MIEAAFDYDSMLAQARQMHPRLIGFCGAAGAGKTFAATHLARCYGYSRVRFAGPLKSMLHALGLTEAETDGAEKDKPCALLGGKTPRHAMQTIGTEWGRQHIDADLWVRAWERAAAQFLDAGFPVVVDDVRFANEASAIWSRGGILIRIDRDTGGLVPCGAHASETQPLHFDRIIGNSGEPEEFMAALDAVVRVEPA